MYLDASVSEFSNKYFLKFCNNNIKGYSEDNFG